MFMLLSGNAKKVKKEVPATDGLERVRELFGNGRFPVVTTEKIEGRTIAKVMGLVCCRGFDSEEAFFGMSNMALKKGAQAIVAYSENVAFHPDGSKYFSCFGTAVLFDRETQDGLSYSSSGYANLDRDINPAPRAQARMASQSYSPSGSQPQSQPTEEEDPVLQRLLASQRREPAMDWQ